MRSRDKFLFQCSKKRTSCFEGNDKNFSVSSVEGGKANAKLK